MESDKTHTYIFRYSFLGLSIISIASGTLSYYIPNSVTVNGQSRQFDEFELLISVVIGLILLILFFLIKPQIVMVSFIGNKVILNNFKESLEVNWAEIENINKIPTIYPPLYSIKLKSIDRKYLFTSQPVFIGIDSFVFDISDMGGIIRQKKKELNI